MLNVLLATRAYRRGGWGVGWGCGEEETIEILHMLIDLWLQQSEPSQLDYCRSCAYLGMYNSLTNLAEVGLKTCLVFDLFAHFN